MEDKEINEGNRLIAYFITGAKCFPERIRTVEDLKYNYSWDWLMPVIDKIHRETDSFVTIRDNECLIHSTNLSGHPVIEFDEMPTIKAVWKSVIELIKWHNQQSK